jgi:hypothetical protein
MTRPVKPYSLRKVVACPECESLRSRRWDLKKHLMENHGYDEARAEEAARLAVVSIVEETSKVFVDVAGSRYEKAATTPETKRVAGLY